MEIWKPIPDYTQYEVSTLGNIRKINRNNIYHIKPTKRTNGYRVVSLTKNKKHKQFRMARLICITFLGLPNDDKLQAAHNNGIRDDDRIENLRWATPKENSYDIELHGNKINGEKHHKVKITEQIAKDIINKYTENKNIKLISSTFNISKYIVFDIISGKSWKYLERNYIYTKKKKNNGVSFANRNKKWSANPTINGKRKWLGYFDTEQEAISAIEKFITCR